MASTRSAVQLACVAAGLMAGSAVVAADNCSGHAVSIGARSVSINHAIELGDARQIMVGACDADGRCIRKDKDGDEQIVDHAYVPGDEAPTWRVVGGTGKYANSAASGWYKQARADADVLVFVWGGDCQATARRVPEVRMTKAELQSTFANAVVTGMCTDGAVFENRYGASGAVAHTTRTIGGQTLFNDENARWFPQDDADGASLCFKWSSGGTSCWKNFRMEDRYVGRENGGQGRTCWFNVVPQ
jgi:hypothetical protein